MAEHPSPAGRRLPWLAMAVVVAVALLVGVRPGGGTSDEDRMRAIASTIKCPRCASQSAATSDAPTAAAIRRDIARRLADGQSPDQIRDYFAGRYGEGILLTPGRSGAAGLVWAIPVVGVVIACAGLVLAFRRWQAAAPTATTDADRELVAIALDRQQHDPHGEGEGR